ncbi:MAG: cbb3-type cytochrome c oxidase subunit I [Verrucomicrobiales bacterium]|nr:cbb3-type cytochrome c oxidase subunit I [Verrucomicrobiota bacterium JB025]
MSPVTHSATDSDVLQRSEIDRSLRHPVMFFLTSGAAWLAVSILLGVISTAKMSSPGLLSDCSWLSYGRVQAAHINTLVYGWGMQAAFAVIIWLMARLSKKQCSSAGIILTAGHVWNAGITLGVLGILSGNGTGMPWMEFPVFAWPVLLISYFVILIWSFVQFSMRPKGEGETFISAWYLLAAMIWFPWVYLTANILLHCVPGHPVMAAGVNAWFRSAMIFLFFVPVGLGAAYFLAGKVTGKAIDSAQLAKIGFWSLALIGPWAGLQKLAGAPVPYFLPYVGATATALLFIPCVAGALNCLRTILTDKETFSPSPTLQFTTAGLVGLVVLGITGAVTNLPGSSLQFTQFSLSGYGFDILAVYGFFTLVMFGATYFIVPRVTRREWLSRRLIRTHFIFSVYGTIFVAIVALFGGMLQGRGQEDWNSTWAGGQFAAPYAVTMTFSWALILFSNVFFFIHLTLMWLRLGRRGTQPTLLNTTHEEPASPHGEDGDIDNAGPGHAPAH